MAARYSLSLRARTLATILAVLVPGTAAFLLAVNLTVRSSFAALEQAAARKDAARCVEALASEVETVKRVVSDYGQWDDSFDFMETRSEGFVTSNLSVETFVLNKLEAVWYVALDGSVVFGRCYDLVTKQPREVPELPATTWPRSHPLLGGPESLAVSGFLPTSLGTLVVSARAVTKSDGLGASRGTIVMGRFLSPAMVKSLSERVSVDFSVLPARSGGGVDGDVIAELEASETTSLRELSIDQLHAYRLVRDVVGRPMLVVRATVDRDISARGRAAAVWAGLYGVLVAAAIMLALHRFFGQNVVRPVVALGGRVRVIAADLAGSTALRLPVERRDELGRLAEDVNVLLASLDETRARLEEARAVAEAASEAKGRFVAHMSHELRTPINGILGMTEVLLRSPLDADQRRCAETVKICSDSLISVVGDVLDISKIEAGRIELESIPVSVEDVLGQAVAIVRHLAQAKGLDVSVRVEPDVPARVLCDPTRIRQVLVNLLGNAVKFTPAGSIRVGVRVEVASAAGGPAELRFAVQDSGVGIPADRIPLLFRPFQQGETSTNRRFGGTGLGLAISRGIVLALGGRMGIESELGHGSTFWFTIPAIEAPPAAAACDAGEATRDDAPARQRLRVLVADDNAVNREVASRLLTDLGHEVRVVSDGREAVQLAAEAEFDVVLMDVHMPHMDGYEAAAAIRARESRVGGPHRLPILALTASIVAGELERCRQAGMDDVLQKPIRPGALDSVLRRIASGVGGAAASPTGVADAPEATPSPVAPTPTAFDLSGFGLPPDQMAGLVRDVAALFREHAPVVLARIRAAITSGDADDLARQAHALKGTCLNLNAPEVVAELSAIEEAARGGDAEVGRARLPAVEAAMAAILLEAEAIGSCT